MNCYDVSKKSSCSLLALLEAHEVKRISQMWKEMGHGQRKACLEAPG